MTQTTFKTVRNVSQRTFNGIKPGRVVNTPNVEYYLQNGFVLVDDSGRNAQPEGEAAQAQSQLTKAQAKELLDKAGIKYDAKANATTLIAMVRENGLDVQPEDEAAQTPVAPSEDDLSTLEDELNG